MSMPMSFATRWQLNFVRRKLAQHFQTYQHTVQRVSQVSASANVLLVTIGHELAETQIYPFHFYAKDIQKAGVRFVQLPLKQLLAHPPVGVVSRQIKCVFFQPELHTGKEALVRALQMVKTAFPSARVVFLDWFAPLHVHLARTIDPYVDVYVKKQVFRRFADFSNTVKGDTNLSDHYARRHQLDYPDMTPDIPAGLEAKMQLWSNFGLSPQMVDLYLGELPSLDNRTIDLHARLAVAGDPWYQAMRQDADDAVNAIKGIKMAREGRVKRSVFFAEMANSTLCFSPFGYGEVCWRDYEAFATGALLLKPDVGHLRVEPDIFVPGETYVPLRWSLDDFPALVNEYLQQHEQRKKICRTAHAEFRRWIQQGQMAKDIVAMVQAS